MEYQGSNPQKLQVPVISLILLSNRQLTERDNAIKLKAKLVIENRNQTIMIKMQEVKSDTKVVLGCRIAQDYLGHQNSFIN